MRSVPEWQGKTDDAEIPPRVKIRIVERAGHRCEGPCHRAFDGKLKPEFDHVLALINGGAHAENNLRAVCHECHSQKSKLDVAAKALTARIRKRHLGIKKPSRLSELWKWKKRILAERAHRNTD